MEGRAARSVMVVLVIWSVIFIFGFFLYSWRNVPIVHAVVRGTTAAMNGMFPHEWTPLTVALFFPLVLAATFAAVAIHEAAHAIVGVLAGFRFNSLRVGRLQFDRPFRISFYRGRGTGSGGWASLFPVKHDRLIVRTIAMLLAGPLSNLISVGLLL